MVLVRYAEQCTEWQLEVGQQECFVRLIFLNRLLDPAFATPAINVHRTPKAVDKPIFSNTRIPILDSFLLVVASLIGWSCRREVDDDGGRVTEFYVATRARPASETSPDCAIGTPILFFGTDVVFGKVRSNTFPRGCLF